MGDQLLSFGHKFPSPGGGSYYLGHEGSEALVDAALKGLRGELHDNVNGGKGAFRRSIKNL